jgi:hypothetical protein
MKKLLLLLALSLVLLLPGCSPVQECTYHDGPANAPWIITYSDLYVRTGNVGPDGTFKIPKHGGENCTQLRLRVGFGNNLNLSLSASPASVYLPSPPSTGTITGSSFDTTYGLPRVDYYDGNGYLIGSALATSVSGGGTSLQVNTPDLSYVYSGTYQVKVVNKGSNGYYLNKVGTASMTGYGRDRVDSDSDGWYDDEDCDPYDPGVHVMCGECGGGDPGPPYQLPVPCDY